MFSNEKRYEDNIKQDKNGALPGRRVVARLGSLIRKTLSEQMRPSQRLTNKELPILWRARAEFSSQKGEP